MGHRSLVRQSIYLNFQAILRKVNGRTLVFIEFWIVSTQEATWEEGRRYRRCRRDSE